MLLKESFLYLLYYSQPTVRYDNAYPMYLLCYVYAMAIPVVEFSKKDRKLVIFLPENPHMYPKAIVEF